MLKFQRAYLTQAVQEVEVPLHLVHAALPAEGSEAEYEEGVRRYLSALWAEDWDSPEDAIYDTW